MTGIDYNMQTTLFFRQQWLGFDGAPRTGFVGVEYPWTDQNMSFGGALITDQTGPISKNGVKITYAYKLTRLLNRDDQLSLGISADFSQFTYDPAGEIFNDSADILLGTSRNSVLFPSVGAGFFYTSNTESFDDNSFYFGLAGTQIYTTDILLDRGNFDRKMHWFSSLGTKIYLDYEYMIEPRLQLNIVNSELIDVMTNVVFEMEEKFWGRTRIFFSHGIKLPGWIHSS